MLLTWPETDVRSGSPQLSLPITASQRIWASEDQFNHVRNHQNQQQQQAQLTTVVNNHNGDVQAEEEVAGVVVATTKRQPPTLPPAPLSSSISAGEGELGEQQEGNPDLDNFCVASFTLPTARCELCVL